MARPLRMEFAGALYHVTARGNERKPIYRDDQDRRRFLQRLAAVAGTYRLVLHAYVLMRNHYHLLLETPAANLSRALRQLNGVYTQDFNRRHRRTGHLFQGRYKAILVDKDSYLLELSRYIHLNPVRVGEVTKPWEFRWSSAAACVGKTPAPDFLVIEEVLGHFGRRMSAARRRYTEFLLDGLKAGGAKPWAAVEGQFLLGERRWVERTKRLLGQRGVAAEERGGRELSVRPPLSVVITQVGRAAKVDCATLLKRGGGRGTWARRVAMALGWELCGMTQAEIGRAFGVGPYAVSKAAARTAELALTTPTLRKALKRIQSNIQM